MSISNLNLYVVDDDEGVRKSLGMLFVSRGYRVQTFESGDLFLAKAELSENGCVILDLRMGGLSGLHVFDELRSCASPLVVVFLSGNGDIRTAVEATKKGAMEWLEKPCSDEQLLAAVEAALGRASLTAATLPGKREARVRWDALTPREIQVALLVREGRSNKEIARTLECGVRAVETHRANFYAKLAVSNPMELDRFMRANELW